MYCMNFCYFGISEFLVSQSFIFAACLSVLIMLPTLNLQSSNLYLRNQCLLWVLEGMLVTLGAGNELLHGIPKSLCV